MQQVRSGIEVTLLLFLTRCTFQFVALEFKKKMFEYTELERSVVIAESWPVQLRKS